MAQPEIDHDAHHWKKLYEEKEAELQETLASFHEFQTSSKEVEEEMERELEKAETKVKEAEKKYNKLKQDMEDERAKQRKQAQETEKQIAQLESLVAKLKQSEAQLLERVRNLELTNDDLERKEREQSATIGFLREQLDKALEDNVWMQTEMEERQLRDKEIIQRLKDEVRDLSLELEIITARVRKSEADGLLGIFPQAPMAVPSIAKTPASPMVFKALPESATAVTLVDDMLDMLKLVEKRLEDGSNTLSKLKAAHYRPNGNAAHFMPPGGVLVESR